MASIVSQPKLPGLFSQVQVPALLQRPNSSPLSWMYSPKDGMPDGNFPLSSWISLVVLFLDNCQQSSRFRYLQPLPASPVLTNWSAVFLMRVSLMLQPNLFQEFQPMGGVLPSPLSRVATRTTAMSSMKALIRYVDYFYQKSYNCCHYQTITPGSGRYDSKRDVRYYAQCIQMRKHLKQTLEPLEPKGERRSSSQGSNSLAKRLYRHSSLTKLTPLNSSQPSLLGTLNTSLIPSVSLKKLNKMDTSQPSLEISHGKIHLRKMEEPSTLSQHNSFLRKVPAHRKFQKMDAVNEKSILTDDLKEPKSSSADRYEDNSRKWKQSSRLGNKMMREKQEEEKLTPQDFMELMAEEGGLGNEFCYLEKGEHPYDLRIVEFGGVRGDEYITISGRGVTYFNWEGSRFVGLQEWQRQARLFSKLIKLEFFGKYRLHKNFTNWKKYARKVAMKKTTDQLKAQLLVNDKHLRDALLSARGVCCRMETETNYCSLDETGPALAFPQFKSAQENYLGDMFEKRLGDFEQEIKWEVANNLNRSMLSFKEENKISSSSEGKGIPLLIGDQKNLEMPYTKEATLRVQQQKFKRFLKLIELVVVHSKINMMDEATMATAHKIEDQNEAYEDHLALLEKKGGIQFKGKQFIECQLEIDTEEERAVLRPTREDLSNYMEDAVNRAIVKLVRNHRRISTDPDIHAILYDGLEEQNRQIEQTNTLKTILGSQERQEGMVDILSQAMSTSYAFIEAYADKFTPLVDQYFRNQQQLQQIPTLTSGDYLTIRQWLQKWRDETTEVGRLSEEHESAVFLLNFRAVKDMTIKCTQLCLNRIKEVVPRILEEALRKEEGELKESQRLMEVAPIGIEAFIRYQNNKNDITNRYEEFEEGLLEIGQLTDIMKELGGSGETVVIRRVKERKQLVERLKALKSRIEEAEMHNKVHETYAQQAVKKMIPKVKQDLAELYNSTKEPRSSPGIMVNKIKEWNEQLASLHQRVKQLRQYQAFLVMQELPTDFTDTLDDYFKLYQEIWTYRFEVQQYYEHFIDSPWKLVCLHDSRAQLEQFGESAEKLRKAIATQPEEGEYYIDEADTIQIRQVLSDIKNTIKPVREAIECLLDPSLEERQMKIIRSELQRKGKISLAALLGEQDVTVMTLVDQGIVEQLPFLKKVVFKSKKQAQINSKMASVSRFWTDSHSTKGLMDSFNESYWPLAAEVEEKITILSCVREDPEVEQGQIRARIQVERHQFEALHNLLSEWAKHHQHLSYLEPIFSNPYWKGSPQYKNYSYAENSWRKLAKQIGKECSMRKLAAQERKHISILRQNNAVFSQLYKHIDEFLNSKREYFPKLYFLSNHQLLPLVLQARDYPALDKEINTIFPCLSSLQLNEERSSPLGVRSSSGEFLALRPSPPKQMFEVEEGLRLLEERVKEGVRSGLLKCHNYYVQDEFNRKQWINDNLLQALLFVGNAEFTKLLESDYLNAEGDDLGHLLAYQVGQLKELQAALKEEAGSEAWLSKIGVMIMQGCFFRDVIERLMRIGVRDQRDFEWQKQVRSYYNGIDTAYTRYLTTTVDYGWEFVCPAQTYPLSLLGDKQQVWMANTIGLGYVPILEGRHESVKQWCISNAKHHYAISLQPNTATTFIHNICQGAVGSASMLQINQAQHLTPQIASLIASFVQETRCLLQKRECFLLPPHKNSAINPLFTYVLTCDQPSSSLSTSLRVKHRTLNIPQISPALYLKCVFECASLNSDPELATKVEKCCEIVNSCSGYKVIWVKELSSILKRIRTEITVDFKEQLTQLMIEVITKKVVLEQDHKNMVSIVRGIILDAEPIEPTPKTRARIEKESTNLFGVLTQVLSKKSLCVLSGPHSGGKIFAVEQTLKSTQSVTYQRFLLDNLSKQVLMGTFKDELWKEGVLAKHLKQIDCRQPSWVVLEGNFDDQMLSLVQSISYGEIVFDNGQIIKLSHTWKFIVVTRCIQSHFALPASCDIIGADEFVSIQERLISRLEAKSRKYFGTNQAGFKALCNMSINNFPKVLKFRLQARFYHPVQLLDTFLSILEATLAQCPTKNLQQAGNQLAIERLFFWCLYWACLIGSGIQNGSKVEAQMLEAIKTDIDRSIVLSESRFELQSAQGAYKRVEESTGELNGKPVFVSAHGQALIGLTCGLVQNRNNVLILGQKVCGKSLLIDYLCSKLGQEHFCLVKVRLYKGMSRAEFEAQLSRRSKVIINTDKEKCLTSINGKQLVLILDNIILIDESNETGQLISSMVTLGHYYDSHNDLIKINNMSIIAAESSLVQFSLSHEFVSHFKVIEAPPLNMASVTELYANKVDYKDSAQICHHVSALYEFSRTIDDKTHSTFFPKTADTALRILSGVSKYKGKENLVKVWEYLSTKAYINAFPDQPLISKRTQTEIKNYSNLLLNNNQQPANMLHDGGELIKELNSRNSFLINDPTHADYYTFVAVMVGLGHNIFTINQPLCPSNKAQVLSYLCFSANAELLMPTQVQQIIQASVSNAKTVVYICDCQPQFETLLLAMMTHTQSSLTFMVDFQSVEKWQNALSRHPSLVHCGVRYLKPLKKGPSLHIDYAFAQQIEEWNNILAQQGLSVTPYQRQELAKIIETRFERIRTAGEEEQSRNRKQILAAELIQKATYQMIKRVQELSLSFETLFKEEEQYRRQLSGLKNNYEADEDEEKKSKRTAAIQSIEAKLNEIMASKRSNQDTSRSIKEEIKLNEKIVSDIGEVIQETKQWLEKVIAVNSNIQSIVTFLALAQFFFSHTDSKSQKVVQKVSSHLPVDLSTVTKCLYQCQAHIEEHSLLLWLINNKSVVFKKVNQDFLDLVQERCPQVRLVQDPKELEEITEIDRKHPYIFTGYLRNDPGNIIQQPVHDSKDKHRIHDPIRQTKDERVEKIDHNKHIYFWIKPMDQPKPKEVSKAKEETAARQASPSPETSNPLLAKSKEPAELMSGRKAQRRGTKLRRTFLMSNSPVGAKRQSSSHKEKHSEKQKEKEKPKPVYHNKLLGESTVRLRRKEVKEGELYAKIDADLQDFLTLSLSNPVYERGFKLVTGCQDKEGVVPCISFMCENTDNCSYEASIRQIDSSKVQSSEDMIEELFEQLDPARTSAIKGLKRDLEQLQNKKRDVAVVIGQKLHENTSRSLKQISQKDGVVYKNMKESLTRMKEQIEEIETARNAYFLSYFQKTLVLWSYLQQVKRNFAFFTKTKDAFKKEVIGCIHYNQPVEGQEGKMIDPQEPISVEQSAMNIKAQTINYVITSLSYEDSVFALSLLSVYLSTEDKQAARKEYIGAFEGIINKNATKQLIQNPIKQKDILPELKEVFQACLDSKGQLVHKCHQLIKSHLNVDLQQAYPLVKSQWFDREEPVVAVTYNGSNPFYHIAQETKTLFIKEGTDFNKAIEMMLEKGFSIMVLVNFKKAELYNKLTSLIEEGSPNFKTILLFSDPEFYDRCQFKSQISTHMSVQFSELSKPHHEISTAIDKVIHCTPHQLEKITKLLLLQELNEYLELKLKAYKRGVILHSASFFALDFLCQLLRQVKITDGTKLLDIASATVLEGKSKWLIKESRKYLKKQEVEVAFKALLGQIGHPVQETNPQLTAFMNVKLDELLEKLRSAVECEKFARQILPQNGRGLLQSDFFYSMKHLPLNTEANPQIDDDPETDWEKIDDLTFEVFRKFESVNARKEQDEVKSYLRQINTRNYHQYSRLQHLVKSLRDTRRDTILSDKTRQALRSIKKNEPVWGLQSPLNKVLTSLSDRIQNIEQMYLSAGQLRKLQLQHCSHPHRLTNLFLYSGQRGQEVMKSTVHWKICQQKPQKGWELGDIELVNVKYDSTKAVLDSDKGEVKIAGAYLILAQKEHFHSATYMLPVYFEGRKVGVIELPSRARDETFAWREAMHGVLRQSESTQT